MFEEREKLSKLESEKAKKRRDDIESINGGENTRESKFLQFYRANDGNAPREILQEFEVAGYRRRRRREVELRLQQFRNDTSRMQVGTCYEASN